MQQHVDEGFLDDAFPVNLDALFTAIGLGAKLGDHAAVDTHAPGHDELFRFASRGNPRTGKNLLQSVCHDRTRTNNVVVSRRTISVFARSRAP